MKINCLSIRNDDVAESFKEAILSSLFSYGKMYELLHKQLWTKNRISFINHTINVNGRDAKPIKLWDIKSYSVEPYNRNNYYNLGLNQLFAEQSPYSTYDGNPKDGIYHDDCFIHSKGEDLPSFDRYGWYIEGHGNWVAKDVWGNTLVTNVYKYEKVKEAWQEPLKKPILNGYGEVIKYVDFDGNTLIEGEEGDTLIEERLEWLEPEFNAVLGADDRIEAYTDGSGNILISGHTKRIAPIIKEVRDDGGVLISYTDSNDNVLITGHDDNGTWVEPQVVAIRSTTTGEILSYEDIDGNTLIEGDVVMISAGWFYKVVTPTGVSEHLLSKVADVFEENPTMYYPSVVYVNFTSHSNLSYPRYSQYVELPDMSEHGDIEFESFDVGYTRPRGNYIRATLNSDAPEAITRVYSDGIAVQFTAPVLYNYILEGDSEAWTPLSGTIKYLPLVYMDTGDLVQNRIDFIDKWDDMFELYVHEDSYWYTSLISIVVIVVAMIIAYVSTGILSGMSGTMMTSGGAMATPAVAGATMGGFIGGIGTVSENTSLQIIGVILSLGTSIYASGQGAIAKAGVNSGFSSFQSASVASQASFSEVFTAYFSNVGFFNLVNIGSTAFKIHNLATAEEFTQTQDEVIEDENSMSVLFVDELDDDPMDYINSALMV